MTGGALARLLLELAASSGTQEWTVLAPARSSTVSGSAIAAQPDGALLVQGPATATDTYTLEFESLPKGVTALRIEALADPSLPNKGPGRSDNGNFVLTELRATLGPKGSKKPRAIALVNASASFSQQGLPAIAAIDGVASTGWAIDPKEGSDQQLVVETRADLELGGGVLTLELEFQNGWKNALGKLRISATSAPRPVRAEGQAEEGPWAEVQARINRAIDAGCEWLLSQQILDGSFDVDQEHYRNGATSLVVYALLKSGIPKSHPAIQRALEFLRGGQPKETYTLGCQLLALAALDDPGVDPWMKQLAEQLQQFQQPNGGFHYGFQGGIDLSNSQYGALGLRAASQHGYRVAPETWEKLAAFVLSQDEEAGGGPYAPVGFTYSPTAKATGSMTAAGAGVLAICDEQLKGRTKAVSYLAIAKRGAEWLGQNFVVDTNPRSSGEWVYYFLYGVERVGALLQMEELGGHRWYREGAKFLVDRQEADGKWSWGGNHPLCNTSWALLFLTRATSATSGKSTRSVKVYGGDDPRALLSIRASGDTPLTFWISSWGEAELAAYEWPNEKGRGLRVKQVEWLAFGMPGHDGELPLATIEKDGLQPSGRERFGGQHAFLRPGRCRIYARARVIAPPTSEGGPSEEVLLESPQLEVKIDEASDPELLRYASDSTRNLLLAQRPAIAASSVRDDYWDAKRLCDGMLARGWASKDEDPNPKLTIELEKPARANLILVTTAVISPDRPARITKVSVTVNGKGPPIELPIDATPDRKTRLRLPTAMVVRRLDLDVTGVTPTDSPLKGVAIAEVELQMESGARK